MVIIGKDMKQGTEAQRQVLDKLYKTLNWKITETKREECSGYTSTYHHAIKKTRLMDNDTVIIKEHFRNWIPGNDIVLHCICDKDKNFSLRILDEFKRIRDVEHSSDHYLVYGEFNQPRKAFEKIAIFHAESFIHAIKEGKIKIDSTFTEQKSYINNDILWGVAKKTMKGDTFITFDIGHLIKIDPNIIFYYDGYVTPNERTAPKTKVDKALELLEKHNLNKSIQNIRLLDANEIDALISFLESPDINTQEIRALLTNKILLNVLNKCIR